MREERRKKCFAARRSNVLTVLEFAVAGLKTGHCIVPSQKCRRADI
jgi:hypothetical protein